MDRRAVRRLVLEQALRLAGRGRQIYPEWHFHLLFDSGSRTQHYCELQELMPDVPWIFEHFSIDIVPASAAISKSLEYEQPDGRPRAVVIFRHGCRDINEDDANRILQTARNLNAHVYVVELSSRLDSDTDEDHLARACDNLVTVRAQGCATPTLSREPCGEPRWACNLDVRVQKARSRAASSKSCGVLELTDWL